MFLRKEKKRRWVKWGDEKVLFLYSSHWPWLWNLSNFSSFFLFWNGTKVRRRNRMNVKGLWPKSSITLSSPRFWDDRLGCIRYVSAKDWIKFALHNFHHHQFCHFMIQSTWKVREIDRLKGFSITLILSYHRIGLVTLFSVQLKIKREYEQKLEWM
jgi:hypothetical protein